MFAFCRSCVSVLVLSCAENLRLNVHTSRVITNYSGEGTGGGEGTDSGEHGSEGRA